ncbi:MAG: nucleotidyltransferase domain-containing protein [Bacteroidota bacterium]
MTIEQLRQGEILLMECVSGSKAYGLDTPQSDTDIKGVFLLPKPDFYALDYIPQVSDANNDQVYYELGRFMELLAVNNPNILELLNTPPQFVRYRSPTLEQIDTRKILSKKCKDTFGKFALSQIKKAKGLNKKIVNPMPKERKTPLDFCYVNHQSGAMPLRRFLAQNNWEQSDCGLTNIPHMKNIYGLYHAKNSTYVGIIKNKKSNDVLLSSIPKGESQAALLYFNKYGYSTYCKDYREYWAWVEKRNEARYATTISDGRNYDAKNMMHTFRLLGMAIEIAREQQINVYRSKDRSFLLQVKSGVFSYEELLTIARQQQFILESAFEKSDLPELPDVAYIKRLAYEIRAHFYSEKSAF